MKNTESENIELYILVFSSIILFSCLAGFIIYFIILYKNRQLRSNQEQAELRSQFSQEILKARLEIQEETQTHISREIHDNITQVLSFVKLNLAMIVNADEKLKNEKINENRELVSQVITDLRDLSKSLSFEHITKLGLVKTIETEVIRINKSGILAAEIVVDGDVYALGEQRELVLFRIFQEALNNTLKYSGARLLKIGLQYRPEMFNLSLLDDGIGFSIQSPDNLKGAGLRNMKSRATIIGAKATINSTPGKGCKINICLNPLQQHIYADGTNSNRVG